MRLDQASIPAEVRARLRTLRLTSRGVTRAPGVGQHASRSRGAGLEFAQYRAYEQGDEPRRIDWKLFARSDRYYVREAERDSPLRVWMLIDTSASMGQSDAARPGFARLDAAHLLSLCITELALRQGDSFGLALLGGGSVRLTPLGSGARHRDRCALALAGATVSGHWPAEGVLRPLWERIRVGDLVVMLGDHFDEGCVAFLERLSIAQREVLSIVLLTREERDFPFAGGHRFRDPESGLEVITDGASARAAFVDDFAQARTALSSRLTAAGIRHTEYVMDQTLDAPLWALFNTTAATA